MTPGSPIRRLRARPFDVPTLRGIKHLWLRHSIAEDARDIDGLIAIHLPRDPAVPLFPKG